MSNDGATVNVLWRSGIALASAGAAIVAWRSSRLHSALIIGILVVGLRLATVDHGTTAGTLDHASWLSSSADILIGIGMITGVLWLVRGHRGRLDHRAAFDGFIAAAGAGLITWVSLVVPALDRDLHPILAIVATAHLPIAAVLFTLTIDLWLDGLVGNRAVRLLVASAACNLLASVLRALVQVEQVDPSALPVIVALYVTAMMLLYLALFHPQLGELSRIGAHGDSGQNRDALRLAPLILAMLVPVCLIALVSPSSNLDRAARLVGASTGAVALIVRLLMASKAIAKSERTLAERLNRDELTGLPTRTRFIVDVSESLDRTWRSKHLPAVIHVSLDRFKNLNDSMGHDLANEALLAVSERLGAAVAAFGGVASRTAGDEFAVLDASITTIEDALHRADELASLVRLPIVVADSMVFVTASIGVAVAPRNRTVTATELMRRADIAVHRAKQRGRDRVALFDDSMQAEIANRMDVEHALHGAIGRNEMRLYQQPIVDISTGRLSGFEALIRWERSPDVVLPPSEFISIAEETGLINELGSWALTEALCDLRRWIDEGIAAPTTTMSVNVSPRQLADPGFPAVVRQALQRSGVSPHLLWIEMTESMMINEPELAKRTLSEIRDMGVRIALDDFGTGYSSLSLLQQFPIQRIKIDRAFVSGIAERSNDRSLVRTIIAMAQSMGLDLVAEGIETIHQLQSLRELGCDKAQGFLISRPVPPEAVRTTIAAIYELGQLSMFQSGGDVTRPMTRPSEPSYPAMTELASHGVRPLGRPFV
ncbi:MAG TPA: bifunctional diguanylate cyclase/phosphodiesterase [Ilumatobacter sp.]|nr:bifunctional diguanylate cyclase/phosphodiesterase [Ilumatobacter sp.]